jgi:hypothetical protein
VEVRLAVRLALVLEVVAVDERLAAGHADEAA